MQPGVNSGSSSVGESKSCYLHTRRSATCSSALTTKREIETLTDDVITKACETIDCCGMRVSTRSRPVGNGSTLTDVLGHAVGYQEGDRLERLNESYLNRWVLVLVLLGLVYADSHKVTPRGQTMRKNSNISAFPSSSFNRCVIFNRDFFVYQIHEYKNNYCSTWTDYDAKSQSASSKQGPISIQTSLCALIRPSR